MLLLTRVIAIALFVSLISHSVALAQRLTRDDLKHCDDLSDIHRLIASCTRIVNERCIPNDLRAIALLKRGMGFYAQKKLTEAGADFEAVTRLQPTNPFAHHELGMVHWGQQSWNKAIAAFSKAIELEPTAAAAFYMRSLSHAGMSKFQEAETDVTTAISLGGGSNTVSLGEGKSATLSSAQILSDYYKFRGKLRFIAADHPAAARDYAEANQRSPLKDDEVIWFFISEARLGRKASRIEMLQQALHDNQLPSFEQKVVSLLLDRVTPADVRTAASTTDEVCEAEFTIAQKDWIDKGPEAGRIAMLSAKERCPPGSLMHHAATNELKQ